MHPSKVLIVSGDSYHQGLQQGEMFKNEIEFNIKSVHNQLSTSKFSMSKYLDLIKKNFDFLASSCPDLVQEMKGISDGSGISLEKIIEINVPAYFMTKYLPNECSMILARENATLDHKTYLIKNRDMRFPTKQVVIEHHYEDGSIITEVNGAGIVTYPANGLNNKGLAIATTGFWSPKVKINLDDISNSHIFINIHLLLNSCTTVNDVIQRIQHMPRMNGLNIIAADHKSAAIIETMKDNIAVEFVNDYGILFRTNHYVCSNHIKFNPSYEEYPSTFERYNRIKYLLGECDDKVRFQDLLRILSDHANGPVNSICRHPNTEATAETDSSSLIVLEDQEMWTTFGNPCDGIGLSKI